MKKLLTLVASVVFVAGVQAATVGWSIGGLGTAYAKCDYLVFVLDQNGVTSTSQVEGILKEKGISGVESYAFASGTSADNGAASVSGANSGKTLGEGTYTAFMILFDTNNEKAVTLSGASGLTRTVASNTTTISFAAGNVSSTLSNSSNWYAVPEPTTVALLALGLVAAGLKRKVA